MVKKKINYLFSKNGTIPFPEKKNYLFTDSARQAWEKILNLYKHKISTGKILLPAYIGFKPREGSGVFDPVENSGLKYRFYKVNKKLFSSTSIIKSELEKGDVRLLLLSHWFGLPHVNLIEIQNLCKKFNVLLVEDCAHVIGGFLYDKSIKLGTYGDCSFYSFNKSLGAKKGGALIVNNLLDEHKFFFSTSKHCCPKKILENILFSDVRQIALHRKNSYLKLARSLKNIKNIKVIYQNIEDHIPHSFPVYVNKNIREKIYFSLIEAGIPLTALYHRLIKEIDEKKFPESYFLSRGILNLPIHQNVSEKLLAKIVKVLRSVLKKIKSQQHNELK